ncbi:hypothetical protein V8E54_004543 [Elaphomyces granulatus]
MTKVQMSLYSIRRRTIWILVMFRDVGKVYDELLLLRTFHSSPTRSPAMKMYSHRQDLLVDTDMADSLSLQQAMAGGITTVSADLHPDLEVHELATAKKEQIDDRWVIDLSKTQLQSKGGLFRLDFVLLLEKANVRYIKDLAHNNKKSISIAEKASPDIKQSKWAILGFDSVEARPKILTFGAIESSSTALQTYTSRKAYGVHGTFKEEQDKVDPAELEDNRSVTRRRCPHELQARETRSYKLFSRRPKGNAWPALVVV